MKYLADSIPPGFMIKMRVELTRQQASVHCSIRVPRPHSGGAGAELWTSAACFIGGQGQPVEHGLLLMLRSDNGLSYFLRISAPRSIPVTHNLSSSDVSTS